MFVIAQVFLILAFVSSCHLFEKMLLSCKGSSSRISVINRTRVIYESSPYLSIFVKPASPTRSMQRNIANPSGSLSIRWFSAIIVALCAISRYAAINIILIIYSPPVIFWIRGSISVTNSETSTFCSGILLCFKMSRIFCALAFSERISTFEYPD